MNDSLPCPAEWHSEEPNENSEHPSHCQHLETTFFDFPQASSIPTSNTLIRHWLETCILSQTSAAQARSNPSRCEPAELGQRVGAELQQRRLRRSSQLEC